MKITDILFLENILIDFPARSKKQVLSDMTKHITLKSEADNEIVFELILEREKLGSTAMGGGIAIPHARVPQLEHVLGAFAFLEQPIDFDALDERPVQFVFLLLAPEKAGTEHLKSLSLVSRILRDQQFCQTLLSYGKPQDIYDAIIQHSNKHD